MTVQEPGHEGDTVRRRGFRRPMLFVGVPVGVVVVVVALVCAVWPSSSRGLVLHTGTARHSVSVAVADPRVGTSDIEVTVHSRAGASLDDAQVQVRADQVLMGHGGAPVSAAPVGSGRFLAEAVPLMMTGQWEIRVSIQAEEGADNVTLPLWVAG
ncbi:FixH family protein [Nocardia callitridis]|uniref:YtkA-like domain-containing protein n=1 Tax=Nocardia callitridis TaxID=648753 RepID=A0ABP9KG87_9NOCA